MDVRLTISELRIAGYIGWDRHARNVQKGRSDNHGASSLDMGHHPLGALGECVVAKATGNYWLGGPPHPDHGKSDLGPWHIRTRSRSDQDLILWPNDPDDEPFVLVVCVTPLLFRIAGWCMGADGKRPEFRATTGRPGWFVPQTELAPFELLVAADG